MTEYAGGCRLVVEVLCRVLWVVRIDRLGSRSRSLFWFENVHRTSRLEREGSRAQPGDKALAYGE
jgi:hypothetical protein